MIDIDEILPFIIAAVFAVILFFGVVSAITKTWRPTPKNNAIDSRLQIKRQEQLIGDVRRQQKRLIEDQKQKMRDMQRR